jgi:hypothetical protein
VHVPAGTASHTADVTVTTPNGQSKASSKYHYKYGDPAAPTVTGLSVSSGTTAGGNSLVVSGTNFTTATTFTFGKAKVTGANCISTSCSVTAPAAKKAGTVDVIAAVGKSKSKKNRPADQYTYN